MLQELFQRARTYRGPQGVRLGVFPALALFDQIGPRRSEFGAQTFQRLDIYGQSRLQALVLGGCQAQRVTLALLGVGPLACLRQFQYETELA
ncbi:hypothetical protein AE921_05690 [Xanthomonas arboricola]|nr:hypothetical protein AKJ12_11885 [Xanthomonas arboricola pv. juglandis]KOB02435.1 hypothetical protein AE921_05690 [Xanthomonas arboricola]KOB03366.1 hypothetical protein AE920_00050 [Xanthomonas arboricola]KOB08001.1 hypothetical protein AE922_11720 [Xanthomonas arboricola]KOB10908.1 hypothetical protein AE923_05370 [Xanthomonas arboricola]